MPSVLRSVAVLAFVSAVAVMSAPGCSQQGEGERCDFSKNGDLDCDSGFTCVKSSELADHVTDRCCPAANTETDSRCTRGGPIDGSGGEANGAGGVEGAGISSAAGAGVGGAIDTVAGSPSIPTSTDGGVSSGGMSSGGTPAANDAGTPAIDPSAGKGGVD